MRPTLLVAVLLAVPLLVAPAGAEEDAGPTERPAPAPVEREGAWPRREPAYTSKRGPDLAPFAEALDTLTPERETAIAALLDDATVLDVQRFFADGTLTAAELVLWHVGRIARYDVGRLNAVLALAPDALEVAARRDAERAIGVVRGPLHGIPVLLKDNIATGDGLSTTAGAWALGDWRPAKDAFVAERLRAAGAVLLGKTNLSEWANWMDPSMPNGFSTLGGQTRNPHGPFDPSGSSSGSAVAVAAGFSLLALGTETQGSLISPGEANGVVALKTSRGLVSRGGVVPLVEALDVVGPLGRTVTDVAVTLGVLVGVDEADPTTAAVGPYVGRDYTALFDPAKRTGMRVGVLAWTEELAEVVLADLAKLGGADSRQLALRQQLRRQVERSSALLAVLREAGFEVVPIPATEEPRMGDVRPVLDACFAGDLAAFLANATPTPPVAALREVVALNREDLANRAPYGQRHLESAVASRVDDAARLKLVGDLTQAARAELRDVFDHHRVRVLVGIRGQAYAQAGWPALSVPSGRREDGQPEALVLCADAFAEAELLAVGHAYEAATRARPRPDLDRTVAEIARRMR